MQSIVKFQYLKYLLKVPKWKILDCLDFHDFLTIKPSWWVNLGLKYELHIFKFSYRQNLNFLIAYANA